MCIKMLYQFSLYTSFLTAWELTSHHTLLFYTPSIWSVTQYKYVMVYVMFCYMLSYLHKSVKITLCNVVHTFFSTKLKHSLGNNNLKNSQVTFSKQKFWTIIFTFQLLLNQFATVNMSSIKFYGKFNSLNCCLE